MMKIAVTYEDGQVFQHFGHCGEFKIYETEKDTVISSRVYSTGESGHGALAGFLKEHGVEMCIRDRYGDDAYCRYHIYGSRCSDYHSAGCRAELSAEGFVAEAGI